MNELHVVFGAEGPLGAAIVRHLVAEGRPVRAVVPNHAHERCAFPAHAEVVEGDARHLRSAVEATSGATVVYRCITAQLSAWTEVWPLITENVIAAAGRHCAVLVCPGSVYVYGRLQEQPVPEDHPLGATGEKGRLRVRTQQLLLRAHESGAVAVVIPRFPDMYGPCAVDRVFAEVFGRAIQGRRVQWPGTLDEPRDFLYVEDAAAAAVLLGRTPSAYGRIWHVPGPGPLTPRQFVEAVFNEARQRPRFGRLSGSMLRAEALFDAEVRAFREFRYLYDGPMVLDGSRFSAAFPGFTYTSTTDGIRHTLDWFRQHYIR